MSLLLKWLFGILALIILTFALFRTPFLSQARSITWDSIVRITGRAASVGSLSVENDVAAQLETLQADNARLRAELHDYNRLRTELGSVPFDNLRSIRALVSGRPIGTFRSELILNRGAKDGVVMGAPVVTQSSQLVGYITELNEHSAVCRLLLNPATTVAAHVLDQEHSAGLVQGRTHTALVLTTVPRDAEIQSEQTVVTSADEQTPVGLTIGTIRSIRNEENEAYQEAAIALPYDPDELLAVRVLVAP